MQRRFSRPGAGFPFVVSSSILFSDYGVSLIRFIGRHYRIRAVVDSMVERWFPDADTNTVLLLLERNTDTASRSANSIRFIRLRRPFTALFPHPGSADRREVVETFVDEILDAYDEENDPRFVVNIVKQGENDGLEMISRYDDEGDADQEDGE